MTPRNGNNWGITLVIGTFATPLPTNNKVPTGGVQTPIHRVRTMIIPKWTGCIPIAITTGKNIGVNISTAGVISIKVPTINKVILIKSSTKIGSLTESRRKPVMAWGRDWKENNHDMAMEVAIRNITIAVVRALRSNIGLKSVNFSSLFQK